MGDFQSQIFEKYFLITEKNDKRKEFLELIQGNMTVREYMTKFERLSRFADNLIDTPEAKNQQYHQGLNWALQRLTLSNLNQPFEALVGLATSQENITKREQKQYGTRPP